MKSDDTQISLSIYPNPATGNSIIISFPAVKEKATLEIYDVLGREVFSKEIAQGLTQLEIPILQLPQGSYCAKIISGSISTIQKFEIIR